MRTSLTEIKILEGYIHYKVEPADRLLMEAKLQLSRDLREKKLWQEYTYELVKVYGKEKLKQKIQEVESHLFNHKKHQSFRERIFSIFKS